MIVKCVKNRNRVPITMDYIYSVISYVCTKGDKKIKKFLIIDDSDSLSWYEKDDFTFLSYNNSQYTVQKHYEELVYTYTCLVNTNFFTVSHLEDENSIEIRKKLFDINSEILNNDCSFDELITYLKISNIKSSIYLSILKAIATKTDEANIIDFIKTIEKRLPDFYEELLRTVADIVTQYSNETVIEFVMELYSAYNFDEQYSIILNKYIDSIEY